MRALSRDSLAPRLITSLVGLITAISLVLVSTLVLIERTRLTSILEDQAQATAEHLAVTLAFPVWNTIFREIDAQLDWVMLDPTVQSVSLLIPDIVPPLQTRSRDTEAKAGILTVQRDIRYDSRSIASLELRYTWRQVDERIAREALSFAALVLVEDLSLALVLFLILRASVFRPLRKIEAWAEGVSRGALVFLPPETGMHGEIRSLYASIERTMGLLAERYGEIVAKEREFRSLFEGSPVPTIELDFSGLREAVLALAPGESGAGLGSRLLAEPCATRTLLSSVSPRSANPRALELYGPSWKSLIPEGFVADQGEDTLALFAGELGSLAAGTRGVSGECGLRIGPGPERRFLLDFATLSGYEEDWSRVMLAMTDITPRAVAETKLRQALAEKDILVKELFHRTRNNLQTIEGLLSIRGGRLSDETTRDELRGLSTCIQAMSMAQAQLHNLGDLSNIGLGDYLRDLVPMVAEGRPTTVSGPSRSGDLRVSIDLAMPLGIALVELASVAFGCPRGKGGPESLSVRFESEAMARATIEVTFADVAMPPGLERGSARCADLELFYALVEGQLQGRAEFDDCGGLRCTLRFELDSFESRV